MNGLAIPLLRCARCGMPLYFLRQEGSNQRAPVEEFPHKRVGTVLVHLTAGTYHVASLEEREVWRVWLHRLHTVVCTLAEIRGRKAG